MTVNDKLILLRLRGTKTFLVLLFFFLALFTGLVLPWLGSVDIINALDWKNLGWFALMISLAVGWNFIYYRVQQKEQLQDFEVLNLLSPLATALLAAIFFVDERNVYILPAIFIAGIALIISRLDHRHLEFDKYSVEMILAIFLIAAEILVRKILLDIYSPASLYFFRTAFIFLIFIILWPGIKLPREKTIWSRIALSALLAAFNMVASFYGYVYLGVVLTTLILMLTPITVYFLDAIVIKEKLKTKNLFAALVILACIIYAVVAK